jgi:hypothetical protein
MKLRGLITFASMRRTLAGTLAVAFLVLAGAVGCGSSGGGPATIASTPLAGKIGGQSWSLGTANSDSFLSSTSPNFYVEMFSDTSIACGGSPTNSNENYFIANVPMATGDYSLSLNLSATFVVGGNNLVATSGHLVVSSVSASTVTGGLNISYNSDNALDGQFTVTVCP